MPLVDHAVAGLTADRQVSTAAPSFGHRQYRVSRHLLDATHGAVPDGGGCFRDCLIDFDRSPARGPQRVRECHVLAPGEEHRRCPWIACHELLKSLSVASTAPSKSLLDTIATS